MFVDSIKHEEDDWIVTGATAFLAFDLGHLLALRPKQAQSFTTTTPTWHFKNGCTIENPFRG
jgi:hypothetical protein